MPLVVGVGTGASGAGAVTPAFPASYSAVDFHVAVTLCECDTTDTITPPSGWAQIDAANVASGTTTKLTALWKRLVAGDTAPQIADAGNHIMARMMIVSGCVATGNPWNVELIATELTADTTVSCPAVTTTAPNCLILNAFSTGQDIASNAGATGWANASLANVVEWMDDWTASGTGGGFSLATGELAIAGSTGNTTATLSLTANFKGLVTIALKGAVDVAAPPARRDRDMGTLLQL